MTWVRLRTPLALWVGGHAVTAGLILFMTAYHVEPWSRGYWAGSVSTTFEALALWSWLRKAP